MDKDYSEDSDRLTDSSWPLDWEDQYLEEYTADRESLEQQSNLEQEAAAQKLWLSFQNSASAVTSLYKERFQGNNSWHPFQHTAGAITDLYKDAMDCQRNSYELGLQIGCSKRIRDLLTWARKRRRHIRRDELIAMLCGKPTPPSRLTRLSPPRSRISSRSDRASSRGTPPSAGEVGPDLTPFQNALAIQGLNGAMSNVSMGLSDTQQHQETDNFNTFIMDSLSQHNESRKRSLSNPHHSDSVGNKMDSPTRKRSRFL